LYERYPRAMAEFPRTCSAGEARSLLKCSTACIETTADGTPTMYNTWESIKMFKS